MYFILLTQFKDFTYTLQQNYRISKFISKFRKNLNKCNSAKNNRIKYR